MTYLSSSIAFMLLSITSALATTAAPASSTTGNSSFMNLPVLGDSSLAQHSGIVLVAVIVAAALWYFMRNRTRPV
jgi:ABC-type uncharacterized transport system permease subunit